MVLKHHFKQHHPNAQSFPLGENFRFETTRMVASNINETNELSGARSMFVDLGLSTTNANVSPVIDLDRFHQ